MSNEQRNQKEQNKGGAVLFPDARLTLLFTAFGVLLSLISAFGTLGHDGSKPLLYFSLIFFGIGIILTIISIYKQGKMKADNGVVLVLIAVSLSLIYFSYPPEPSYSIELYNTIENVEDFIESYQTNDNPERKSDSLGYVHLVENLKNEYLYLRETELTRNKKRIKEVQEEVVKRCDMLMEEHGF